MPSLKLRGKDFGGEPTSVGIFLGTTAVSGANYAAFAASISALIADIQPLSYIPLHEQFIAIDEAVEDQASAEEGQREKKWRVRYVSTVTGKRYSIEIPGAILTGNLVAGTDFLNIASGDGLAFKTVFEAEAREPGTNNSVTVVNVQFVGRTL